MNKDNHSLGKLYLESTGATFDATLGPHAAAPLQEPILTRIDIEDIDNIDNEEEEHSHHNNDTIKSELYKISEYGPKLLELIDNVEIDPWVQSKIAVASDHISSVYHFLKYKSDESACGCEEVEGGVNPAEFIDNIMSGI